MSALSPPGEPSQQLQKATPAHQARLQGAASPLLASCNASCGLLGPLNCRIVPESTLLCFYQLDQLYWLYHFRCPPTRRSSTSRGWAATIKSSCLAVFSIRKGPPPAPRQKRKTSKSRLRAANLVIFAGPREMFTVDEFTALKAYLGLTVWLLSFGCFMLLLGEHRDCPGRIWRFRGIWVTNHRLWGLNELSLVAGRSP